LLRTANFPYNSPNNSWIRPQLPKYMRFYIELVFKA